MGAVLMANNALLQMIAKGGNFDPVGAYMEGVAFKEQRDDNILKRQMRDDTLALKQENALQSAQQSQRNQDAITQMFGPEYAGMSPKLAVDAYKAKQPPAPLVTMSQAIRTADQEAKAKTLTNREQASFDANQAYIDAGTTAGRYLPVYGQALNALDDVETGFGTETRMKLQGMMNALGINVDIANLTKLEALYPAIQAGIFQSISESKGAISDKEMQLFEKFGTSFGKSTAGNKMLLRYKLAQAQRAVKIKNMALDLRDEGMPAAQIRRQLDQYVQDNDLSESLFDEILVDDEGNRFGVLPDQQIMQLSY